MEAISNCTSSNMVKVAIIGCGTLGTKIAGSLAYNGHDVRVFDADSSVLNRVNSRVGEDRRMLREYGFLSGDSFLGDLYCFSLLEEAVKGCQFVIESITEDLENKKELFKAIQESCPEDAILATSTLRLPVDEVFQAVTNKERCLAMRFLYPVYCIPEVEIMANESTSGVTLEKVRQFLERMGQVAFFRSGPDPIVLSDAQRESRRNAYIRQLKDQRRSRISASVPDLRSSNPPELFEQLDGNPESSGEKKEKECVVCMDTDRNCVLHPCHHLCTCITCGKLLFNRRDACPICRRAITSVFRVFHS